MRRIFVGQNTTIGGVVRDQSRHVGSKPLVEHGTQWRHDLPAKRQPDVLDHAGQFNGFRVGPRITALDVDDSLERLRIALREVATLRFQKRSQPRQLVAHLLFAVAPFSSFALEFAPCRLEFNDESGLARTGLDRIDAQCRLMAPIHIKQFIFQLALALQGKLPQQSVAAPDQTQAHRKLPPLLGVALLDSASRSPCLVQRGGGTLQRLCMKRSRHCLAPLGVRRLQCQFGPMILLLPNHLIASFTQGGRFARGGRFGTAQRVGQYRIVGGTRPDQSRTFIAQSLEMPGHQPVIVAIRLPLARVEAFETIHFVDQPIIVSSRAIGRRYRPAGPSQLPGHPRKRFQRR